jgi:hypothetical protein
VTFDSPPTRLERLTDAFWTGCAAVTVNVAADSDVVSADVATLTLSEPALGFVTFFAVTVTASPPATEKPVGRVKVTVASLFERATLVGHEVEVVVVLEVVSATV